MLRNVLGGVLRFRLLTVGLAAGVLVLGAVTLRHMPSDAVPELAAGPVLEVQTEALGLSSNEVEAYITTPLENNLLDGIMGVHDVRSRSVPGLSAVDLEFAPGTSVAAARLLVQERLTRAFSLPKVAAPPQLMQPVSSTGRVMMIGLSSRSIGPLQLSYLARWVMRPRLAGVPGVANVAIFHRQDRQIEVQVDPARLAARHITLNQIIRTAGNAQLVSPLSYLEGSSPGTGGFLDQPNQRLEIRPVLPLGTPRDLASVPITGAPGRTPLGSVTSAVENHQPLIGDAVVGGGDGLVLEVQKLPSASAIGVTRSLDRALAELRPALRGVRIDSELFRPATYVSSSFHNIGIALLVAALLTLLALLAFLLDAPLAMVGLVSVALSLVAATLVLRWLDYSFNALVVLGLVLAATVVVDDAITSTRELHRRRAGSEDHPTESLQRRIIAGCAPLRTTLGYATLIVLLSGVPAFLAKGPTATFVHPMLLAFALAVLASMAVAVTFTSAAGMLVHDRRRPGRERNPLRRVEAAYGALVPRALALPRAALLAVCLLGLAGLVVLPFVGQPKAPAWRDRSLVVQWVGPQGASLREMKRVTGRVVRELRALPSVADAGATLGRAVATDQIVDSNAGQLFVTIRPSADYDKALAAIRGLTEGTPGIHASVGTYEDAVARGVLVPKPHDVTVRVYGESDSKLNGLARKVARAMGQVHGVSAPGYRMPVQQPNIQVAVEDSSARDAGVLPGDARRAASTLVSGLTVGNFFERQAVFDVVVRGAPAVRRNVGTVRNLLIDTSKAGGHVRLGQIGSVRVNSAPVDIRHEALARYVDVTAHLGGTDSAAAATAIRSRLKRMSFPLEYHAEVLSPTVEEPTSHTAFLSYVAAVVVGMILLLQAAFASWRLAGLFALMLPVAFTGGILVAVALGEQGSLGALAGLLGVFAFAVRQGMLLVVHLRGLHGEEGSALTPAVVVRAAADRFSPAAAAAVTLIVALVPFVVMGDLPGNEMTHVAAAVMIGGVVSSTLLNLFVLPALCLALGPREPAVEDEPEEARVGFLSPTPSREEGL
jgi:Cu/Ag efflux pump CusA